MKEYKQQIREAVRQIREADAVVVGAGAGLSAAAGFTYAGQRFQSNFSDFIKNYGMKDMYSAGFYPFASQEEKWAYWSRHIQLNRYGSEVGEPYKKLLKLLRSKDYFVITTNVDHQFQKAGFSQERLFAVQGDYGYFQCEKACHNRLYENETLVAEMVRRQKKCKIPEELIPKCPVCGGNMEVNLRKDEYFVEDKVWKQAARRYDAFINKNANKNLVFLELGVGMNTPGIIKFSFWKMTCKLVQAGYICFNRGEAYAPEEIEKRSICINEDITVVMEDMESEVTK